MHGASMIDDPHTILMILQLHISLVKMANHLRGNSKPGLPGVEHLVPNGQLYNKYQKRSEDTRGSPTRGCAWLQWQHGPVHHHLTMEQNQSNIARGTKSPHGHALPFPSQLEINLEKKTCEEMSKK